MTNTASSMIRRGMSVLVIGGALVATALAGSTGAQANGFGGHGFGGHGFGGHGFGGHGWGHHGWGHGGGFGLAVGLGGDDYYGSTRVCSWQRQFDADGDYLGRVRVCRLAGY